MQSEKVPKRIINQAIVPVHCARSDHVRSSPCLATCSSGLYVVCWPHLNHTLLHTSAQTHSHTHTPSAHRLLSSAGMSTHQLAPSGGLEGCGWEGRFSGRPSALHPVLWAVCLKLPSCQLKDSSVKCLSLSLSVCLCR